MIKFIKKEEEKRQYQIVNQSADGTQSDLVCNLNLNFSPITNKFYRLVEFVEDCSVKIGPEFDQWYCGFLKSYIDSNFDYLIVKDNVDKLIFYCDKYLDIVGVNFEDYINRSKSSKNSIFFDAEEIKKIIKVANYLKIYFIISQDSEMKLNIKFHKEIYNRLTQLITNENIIYKLFKIVSSKTYEYNHTDRYMWEYIKTIYCKTTDMHIFSIFNFLMNNILVTCSTTSNPIPYLISVIDESIKWILRNIYKDAIIYSDTITTQDVYSIQGKDNLESYSHNDTIGKILISAYNLMEEIGIEDLEKFKNTLNNLKEISLFSTYVTYPILSKVLDIPYRHFLTLSVNNSYLLNIFMFHNLPADFKAKYPILSKMLLCYNKEKPILKTTYKIKNIQTLTKSFDTFMGFKSTMFAYDLYSNIIGKISRNSYNQFSNDQELTNFPLGKLESDFIEFYNGYFSNGLDEVFTGMKNKIDRSL